MSLLVDEYPHYQSGFFFSEIERAEFRNQYACYIIHSSLRYPSGLTYPSHRLERFSLLGESYFITNARSRRSAERKIRRALRKYYRKNIL